MARLETRYWPPDRAQQGARLKRPEKPEEWRLADFC
jgi:hypothetical protein